MCSNFERSSYEIMRRFDTSDPKSVEEIYNELWKDKVEMWLADGTIADFIKTLYLTYLLREDRGSYTLTERGVNERDRLRELVGDDSQTYARV